MLPNRDEWRLALVIALALFFGTTLQQAGIETTSATNAGFLTACYVVLTPFVVWAVSWSASARNHRWCGLGIARRRVAARLGRGLAPPNIGDALVLLADFAWATVIALTPIFLARSGRPLLLAFVQYTVCAGLAALCSALFESIPSGALVATLPTILFAGIVSGAHRLYDPDLRAGAYATRRGGADPRPRRCVRCARGRVPAQ